MGSLTCLSQGWPRGLQGSTANKPYPFLCDDLRHIFGKNLDQTTLPKTLLAKCKRLSSGTLLWPPGLLLAPLFAPFFSFPPHLLLPCRPWKALLPYTWSLFQDTQSPHHQGLSKSPFSSFSSELCFDLQLLPGHFCSKVFLSGYKAQWTTCSLILEFRGARQIPDEHLECTFCIRSSIPLVGI